MLNLAAGIPARKNEAKKIRRIVSKKPPRVSIFRFFITDLLLIA